MNDCKLCQRHMPDLLLDTATAAPQTALEHLSGCEECRTKLDDLRSTLDLLGEWSAPEPSPYFDVRLRVRLREAEAAPPEGVWERVRAYFLFSSGRSLRPAVTGALALALLAGGGTFLGMYEHHALPGQTQASSATVNDLRIFDNNAQALQQMDQLLDDPGSSGDQTSAPPTT